MKIGFVGAGNMAGAMLKGFVGSGAVKAEDVFVHDPNKGAVVELENLLGIRSCVDNKEVVRNADVIFLCVKPQVMSAVLEEVSSTSRKGKTFVSIAAGLDIAFFEAALDGETAVIRLMPNVNMMVCQSMTSMCANRNVQPESDRFVEGLLASVGRVARLPEKDFAIFSAIAGCSPAYAFLFVDAIARTAVEYGLPKAVATEIAAQAVMGSGANLLASGEIPWAMIDKVCSPGGTTIAGLAALQQQAFPAVVASAIRAAHDKDLALRETLTK